MAEHSDFLAPMLVSEVPGHQGRINAEPYVFVQPKHDGHCCMANTRTRRIYSRSGHEITTLPHINAALPVEGPEWLHGELWKDGATSDSVDVMIKQGDTSLGLHVFDCVGDKGFKSRMMNIFDSFIISPPVNRNIIFKVPTWEIMPEQIEDIYARFLSEGYEGIIIRLDGHGYYHGRSQNVFKMKPGTEAV